MLEAVGAGSSKQMGGRKDWADRWIDSEEHAANKREIEALKQLSSAQKADSSETAVLVTSCKQSFPFIYYNWSFKLSAKHADKLNHKLPLPFFCLRQIWIYQTPLQTGFN